MNPRGRLDSLVSALEAEQRLVPAARETGAGDASIAGALRGLERARTDYDAGDGAGALARLEEVAHQVTDSWAYGSDLARQVVALTQDLRTDVRRRG